MVSLAEIIAPDGLRQITGGEASRRGGDEIASAARAYAASAALSPAERSPVSIASAGNTQNSVKGWGGGCKELLPLGSIVSNTAQAVHERPKRGGHGPGLWM